MASNSASVSILSFQILSEFAFRLLNGLFFFGFPIRNGLLNALILGNSMTYDSLIQ